MPTCWDDVILRGPHLFVATPLYKTPNKTMLHNQDWSKTDFEQLAPDVVPVTSYKPAGNRAKYDSLYGSWEHKGEITSPRQHYRLAWRAMAANTNERTLIPTIIPPGAGHINGVFCVGALGGIHSLLAVASFSSSLLCDFAVRVAPKSGIYQGVFERLPVLINHPLRAALNLRLLRLSSVVDGYRNLWEQGYEPSFRRDSWTFAHAGSSLSLGQVHEAWTLSVPLRLAVDRRRAQVELDALVALMLGVTPDELCVVYRTQFPVLFGYDRNDYLYDANGRIVPNSVLAVWRKKGDRSTEEDRSATNQAGNTYTYQLPFVALDREADMRQAYTEFERRLAAVP